MKSVSSYQGVGTHNQNEFDLPLDNEVIFSDHKKNYKKRIEKQQRKLLKKIPFIKKFLKEDEKILLLTTGCSPTSILEQMLTGWIFIYLKRSLLVFTNKRIFHIPTKQDFSYRNSVAQILYADCKSITLKRRNLLLEYQNGKKEKFLYIPNRVKKRLLAMLPKVSSPGIPGEKGKRVHLCPRCTGLLEEDKYTCPNCHLAFKDMDEARRISLIYPGGGYFYTRHPILGIGDALVETIFLFLVITSLIGTIKGVEGSGISFGIFALFLAVEKAITVYHSNHFVKEYIPKEKEIKPIP